MSGSNEKDLSELERTLAGLAPSPAGFDRDRLMFQAGQSAAAPRRRWLWPSATAVMTTVAACLGGVLLVRPAPEQVVRYVHVERDPQPPVISPDKPVQPEKPRFHNSLDNAFDLARHLILSVRLCPRSETSPRGEPVEKCPATSGLGSSGDRTHENCYGDYQAIQTGRSP